MNRWISNVYESLCERSSSNEAGFSLSQRRFCNPFLSPFTWRYEFPKEFHFEVSWGKSVMVSKGWETREVNFIRKLLETYLDTSSWDTARGVAVPWRARDDAWRDSCEYASELFSNAETEPFCFPVKIENDDPMKINFTARRQQKVLIIFVSQ